MKKLSESDKQHINQLITKVEASTRGEIVTVLAKRCDSYLYIPTLWAALIALSVPGINFIFAEALDSVMTYQLQVLVFISLSWLFQIEAIKMRLIPKSVKHRRATRTAHEQFVLQGLHTTEQRSGVLIFVSEAERFVKIIADKGINDKVNPQHWQQVVDALTQHIKQGDTLKGFLGAISACQAPLVEHFPITGNENPNELRNHLVEI